MTIVKLENYINEKIKSNEKRLIFSYYQVCVEWKISKNELDTAKQIIKNKLESNNYYVYFTGQNYYFERQFLKVQENELIIAIKK